MYLLGLCKYWNLHFFIFNKNNFFYDGTKNYKWFRILTIELPLMVSPTYI